MVRLRMIGRVVVTLSVCLGAGGQVLARPGWAGSGVVNEPWWRRAVIYRIDPARFQDSDGNGVGDLPGIAQRLDYVQRLGVDAILLAPGAKALSADEFGVLARKAADAHVRVMVEMRSADVAEARGWLNQGAAGLYVDTHALGPAGPAAVRELRHVVDGFPGERVLIANGTLPTPDGAELSVSGSLTGVQRSGVGLMRQALQHGLDAANGTGNALLVLDGVATGGVTPGGGQAIQERTLAAMLMGSKAAVIFDAGRELGLRTMSGEAAAMQWTPSNVTRAQVDEPEKKPSAPQAEVYGTYTPYVPAPKAMLPAPKLPEISVAAQPDPNTLPGFSSSEVAEEVALSGNSASAAVEDVEPNSLLNFYRHLIALHHDNGSLRNGSQTLFDRDALNSMVWVRRAPAGSKTAASVVVAANLSEVPAELSLSGEFAGMHVRGGVLRPLLTASAGEVLSSAGAVIPVESADHMVLPAFTVFLGELYHEGAAVVEEPRHAGRRKRRR